MPKVGPGLVAAGLVLGLGLPPAGLSTERGRAQPADTAISSAFDPGTRSWKIEWPGRVSQYDLVYLSPPVDPLQGIPLGNGDLGVLFWCEGSKLIAAVNKCDLWDDAPFGRFHNWKKEEEDRSTTLRHACRLVIDFGNPVFDTLYLSDFTARLSLADASFGLEALGPFGSVKFRAFVERRSGLLLCDLTCDFTEDVPVEIAVERFGSRTFSHWYSLINGDTAIGLAGTDAGAADGRAWITQRLSGGTFAAGGAVIGDNGLSVTCARDHSRRSLITLRGKTRKQAEIAFAVTSPLASDPVAALHQALRAARDDGLAARRPAHADAWRAFWLRSFMDYGDDYLNRLWHLTMYYANSSQGGRYPGRFTNGLWGWNRDVQNWNFYFHWNQQQVYWPLNAAGHHELVAPYLDYRWASLPHARDDAREVFHAAGAWVSDVTDRRGYNSLSETDNHTPVAEIALDFWRQYKFTGDGPFLKDRALPYMLEAARFLASRLVKEPDGLYHALEATGYEGWIKLKDTLSELVYARALLAAAIDALAAAGTEAPEARAWKDILRNCAPLPVIPAGDAAIGREAEGFRLKKGFFAGRTVPTGDVVSAGWGVEEKKWLSVFVADDGSPLGFKPLDGIFPTLHLSPVFPSGWIGLAQKGSPLFDVMTATALLYSPEVMGWDPLPIVLARLGLAAELERLLDHWPERWQIYPNGWGHIGVEAEVKKDAQMLFRTNRVRDARTTAQDGPYPAGPHETFPFPAWPFRHMSMESMSVLAAAMNESLLQGGDGVLRTAPGLTPDRSARFTLHAEGGFIVSSEVEAGRPMWVAIESLRGNRCLVAPPWPNTRVYSTRRKAARTLGAGPAEIPTAAGELILLLPDGGDPAAWKVVGETPGTNAEVHWHRSGKAQLGLPRMH